MVARQGRDDVRLTSARRATQQRGPAQRGDAHIKSLKQHLFGDGTTVVYMSSKQTTNNERLRELVDSSKLTQAVSLTIFNRGLGSEAYSESAWKA